MHSANILENGCIWVMERLKDKLSKHTISDYNGQGIRFASEVNEVKKGQIILG